MASPPEVETPAAPFQLSLPEFEGPVPELVRLVEEGRMVARALPLAALTGQVVAQIQPDESLDLHAAGDFLRAATRLMLLKSESLLPTTAPPSDPVEDFPAESPDRLVEQPGFRRAAGLLAEQQGAESFPAAPRIGAVARATEPRPPSLLRRAWEELRKRQGDPAVHVAPPVFLRLEVALSRLIR
ncbi:MAG: hypothetical protein JOZ41_03375, partial [Chloroflexi bacterium]|nr:hypothetical protein [Chloroflexota bacterium]